MEATITANSYNNVQLDGYQCTDRIPQMDGNDSISSAVNNVNTTQRQRKLGKFEIALNLPTVASYNVRSLFPKIGRFKTDMIERGISVSFVSEIWEQSENKEHAHEIETMLEMDELTYISTSRPSKTKGGVAAIIVNLEKYSI